MRLAGHAARRERREMNTEFQGGETEGKETAWKNDIKMNYKCVRVTVVYWIHLA